MSWCQKSQGSKLFGKIALAGRGTTIKPRVESMHWKKMKGEAQAKKKIWRANAPSQVFILTEPLATGKGEKKSPGEYPEKEG